MPSIAPFHQRQMATQTPMLSVSKLGFFVSILLVWVCCSVVVSEESYWEDESDISRRDFPPGFVFGASSASYQIEGGVAEGGRKPSIWDTFTHKYPEKIKDGSNGDVAADSYHLYKADVQNLKDMNMDAYRFSISWSRILPFGTPRNGFNKKGVAYYNHLIDSILDKGMKPFVTIFHWDVPQALEEEYGGFRSERIVDDFREYADLCFSLFGDRVKHWITVNEPSSFCVSGYAKGKDAPGRCSPSVNPNCTGGNSGTEPYIVAHNLLLAHAAAVDVYKNFYQEAQRGQIGLTLVTLWYIPLENTKPDKDASDRALDFQLGWFLDPVTYGDYPFIMKALVGERLPKFTPEQSRMLKGSYDFVGLNYYTTHYALDVPLVPNSDDPTYQTDSYTNNTGFRNGKPIGRQAASEWLFVYPPGIKHLLLYTKNKYNNPIIYITENGVDEYNNKSLPIEEALKDDDRITFHRRHLKNIQEAIRQGARVNGYFVWSLLDNFEWASGYTVRFGLYFVDFDRNPRIRLAKKSAGWFADILKNTTKDPGHRALDVAYGRIRIKGLKNYI